MADTPAYSPFEPTVQMQRPVPRGGRGDATHRPVAIVEGSGEDLSQQTYSLRCERLRTASLLLCAGYLVFLIRSLFSLDTLRTTADWVLFWDHVAITLVTGFIGWRLSVSCRVAREHLAITELLVFGGSALFFVFFTYVTLVEGAAAGYITAVTPAWLLLIYIYALFIPNRWQRAAIVIGVMATAPILTYLYVWMTSTEFDQLVSTVPAYQDLFSTVVLVTLVGAVTAIAGVRTMGLLRREAYEAKQIGQYRLKRPLGSGGMGDVFLAEHVLLKRPCAIKLIKPQKAGDPNALARFEQEVQATAKLTHWNTVEIFDYGRSEDGTFYYVMEYLPGMNLSQLVEMCGPLPPERVIHLITQTCDALQEAHQHGLIHRDIKPANVFAANRGGVFDVAKLLDFGLVKPLEHASDSHLTQEGMVAGSPMFMSPEQVTGEELDPRSDIYALGIVMYFLLTGRPPFISDKPMKVLIAQAQESPQPIREVNPDVPPDLASVIMRCLEKKRENRFPNVVALREALEDCASAGLWTRERARQWWQCSGCPQKKALDAEVFDGVCAEAETELATV